MGGAFKASLYYRGSSEEVAAQAVHPLQHGHDIMSTNTLLIILVVLVLLGVHR